MAAPFVITPEAEKAHDNGVVSMNVLLAPGQAEGFAMFLSTFPPLGGGPPMHHHESYDEAFYVLSGEMEFRVEGQTALVAAGLMAWVPRGATHGFRNPHNELATMLVITTPAAIDLIARMPEGLRSPEAMRALFAEHTSHLDGPPLG